MADTQINPADVEHRLWDEVERSPVGMLMALGGHPRHAQPMSAFVERDGRQLWFFVPADAEIAVASAGGAQAMFVYQQRDLYACIGGRLYVRRDQKRIDRYWNAVVAAWRPAGRDDPGLTLLCLDCDDAEVWVSDAGPMKFVWEIAMANARHREPDLGAHTHLTFH